MLPCHTHIMAAHDANKTGTCNVSTLSRFPQTEAGPSLTVEQAEYSVA